MKLASQQVKSLFILSLLNSIHGSAENSLLAGSQLSVGNETGNTTFAAGFAVSKTNPDGSVINQGVLTSSFVFTNVFTNVCDSVAKVGDAVYNWTENNPVPVGQIDSLLWGNSTGLCYTYITVSSPETVSPYVLRKNDQGVIEQIPVTAIATPNQINTTVCGYGSANGYFCGIITGFNATSWNICNPLLVEDLIALEGLTVVNTENHSISLGDNGGPIYIENESDGIITAQAVGIITLIDQGNNDTTLLYTPINNLLAAQGFNLMIANVSTTSTTSTSFTSIPTSIPTFIPPVSGENYVELWLDNYLANGLPVCGITEKPQLVKRVDPIRMLIRAGKKISITENQCTVGFGVYSQGVHAIITAGHCVSNVGDRVSWVNDEGTGSIEVGLVERIEYNNENGNNYAIIRLYSLADGRDFYFQFVPKIPVLIETNPGIGKIRRAFENTEFNQEVCGYGAASRRTLCGRIIEFDRSVRDGAGITLQGLVKVSVGNQANFQVGDDGAPIYVTLGQYSQDVGAVGHMVGANDANPQDKFFYYEPIRVIHRQYDLILDFPAPDNNVVYGGRKIYVTDLNNPERAGGWNKQCTIGFAVKNIVSPDKRVKTTLREGFITAAHCFPSTAANSNFPVYASQQPEDKFGAIRRRLFEGSERTNSPTTDNDYALVMLNIEGVGKNKKIKIFPPQPLVKVITPTGATAFYPVVEPYVSAEQDTVEAYGAVSGYKSGVIDTLNAEIVIATPWRAENTIRVTGLVRVVMAAGQNFFINVGEDNRWIGDDGAPVYRQDDLTQTVQAAGLLIYSEFNVTLQRSVFYYLPIQQALERLEVDLMTRDNQNQNIQPRNLASENLAAQIEVPVK